MAEHRATVLGMLALGALLATLRAGLGPPPAQAVDALDDESLLVQQGLAAGWARTDAVVRARLIDNLKFAGRQGSDAELVQEALDLGMHRTDPVVRLHLAARARRALESVREPTEAELQRYLSDHADRFSREPVLDLDQELVGKRIAGIEPRVSGTPRQLASRFGFAPEALSDLAPGDQVELRSSYGLHRVRVVRRTEGGVPELAEIEAEVRAAWQSDERDGVVQARLAALRSSGATR